MATDDETAALTVEQRSYDGVAAIVAEFDFRIRGGTFGVAEATLFRDGCARAVAERLPLVSILRSGGTRLQEGMHSLVGIPRAALALRDLAAAGVPHVSIAAHPTTGGVWVTIGSVADVRAAVHGATVGFSGPRVVAAMTGHVLPAGANTAETAAAAGLVDELLDAGAVDAWIARVLATLAPDTPQAPEPVPPTPLVERTGWEQVQHSRHTARVGGHELLDAILPDAITLRGADDTVAAAVGRLDGRRVIAAAVAAGRAERVRPAGYRLLTRAAQLADRWRIPLVTFLDTAGADPLPESESKAVAAEIAVALGAVLACASPTITVVHGEGGSGGALAAAVTDVVGVTPDAWFAAIGPEGGAAALRTTEEAAADLMRVTPMDLVADGFADAVVPAQPSLLVRWLATTLDDLSASDPDLRREQRELRWSRPLGSGLE